MIQKAIDRILGLAKPEILEINGQTYTSSQVYLAKKPTPNPIAVHTLTALVDYLKADQDQIVSDNRLGLIRGLMIHVVDHLNVRVISQFDGVSAVRTEYLVATHEPVKFGFGQYMDQETFVIEVQSKFLDTASRKDILRIAGNLKSEHVRTIEDDGITQVASTRKGISLAQESIIPNPIILKPYRTFLEVEQPELPFVFRLRDARDNQPPVMALFEADGGQWKLDSVDLIRQWLNAQLPEFTVLA